MKNAALNVKKDFKEGMFVLTRSTIRSNNKQDGKFGSRRIQGQHTTVCFAFKTASGVHATCS